MNACAPDLICVFFWCCLVRVLCRLERVCWITVGAGIIEGTLTLGREKKTLCSLDARQWEDKRLREAEDTAQKCGCG
jgi:hypothetical protein